MRPPPPPPPSAARPDLLESSVRLMSSARRRTARSGAILVTALAVMPASGLTPAAAAPITPAYPTVFISQTSGNTTLKVAAQSRLANAGAGGVTISDVATAAFAYNATAFREADNYLYAIASNGQLVRIQDDGSAAQLGAVSISGGGSLAAMYSGAFGGGAYADTYFVRAANSTSLMYLVDVDARTATSRTLSEAVTSNDFTWAYGYLWGVQADKQVVRINPADGAVTKVAATALFPLDDASQTSGYGAAWTYGNGNLAFSNNFTGYITQLAVTNPGGSPFSVSRVSTIVGPSTSQNDGATTPSQPVDLVVSVSSPPAAAPNSPIAWTVTVTNDGPGGSSGAVVQFPVPPGVTGVVPPDGCTVAAGQVQCVTDPIANGGSNSFVFSATSPAPGFVSSAAPVTVIGNEEDPNPGGATLTVTPAPTHLTTSGIGPDPQTTTVAKPGGATLALLDGDGNPATTVTVPGVGTYVADPTTGVITFTPVLGYVGTPAGVEFLVTGTGGTASGDYTPTVLPPNPPLVPDLTTTGVSAAPQQATLPALPSGGSATLLDGDGNPATTVTVPGQGTYVLSGGVITFTPAPLYVGTATAVTYRVTDAYNQSDTGTYTPTVTAPAPPVALPFTSTGAAPDPQSPASPITIPAGGSVTLLDGDGNPATSVTVPGQGTYTLNTTTGVLTFTPVPGYTGTATAVTYRVTDAYGQSASSTYTPTVTPPPAPSAPDETTSGVGTAPQTATFPVPTGGSITLLDGDGNPATTVTVPGQGSYVLDPATGAVTFTPVLGFVGGATPVTYRVTDAYGQTDTGTHTPTVTAPAGPSAPPFTSTGPVSTDQQVTLPIPTGGIVRLLDGDGDPVTTVTVPGVGTYVLVPATGVTTFTPAAGYSGTAPAVGYRVTDAYGQSAASTYTPTVTPPAPPAAPDRDTTQTGTATHTTAVSVPSGGSVTLLDGDGNPATTVTIPGQGSYVLDPATGAVTFTPVLGFSGPATPVDYRVTDAYGQTATGTYSPTVLRPPAPSAAPFTSSGATGSQQSPGTTIPVPAGGTVRLLDASGNPVATMTVPGQGTYSLDPATGALTFTPTAGFTGTATAVTYQVTDAYGQSVSSTYTAVVTPAPAPTRAPSGALAATGGAPLQLVGFGAALVIGGALLVLTSRRRTAQATVSS